MTGPHTVVTEQQVMVLTTVRVMRHGGIEMLIDPLDLDLALPRVMRDAASDAVARDDVHLAIWPQPDLGGS